MATIGISFCFAELTRKLSTYINGPHKRKWCFQISYYWIRLSEKRIQQVTITTATTKFALHLLCINEFLFVSNEVTDYKKKKKRKKKKEKEKRKRKKKERIKEKDKKLQEDWRLQGRKRSFNNNQNEDNSPK